MVCVESLVVCFCLHETLGFDAFTGSGGAVDVYGVRYDGTAAASVAGVAKGAYRPAGGAQGRSRHSYLDCSQRYDRSPDCAERGTDADLSGT